MQTKNTKQTPWTQNQQYQLQAIRESAAELMEKNRNLSSDEAFETTLIQLQQKYPLVLPMLLLEAMYHFVENSDFYDTTAKADARSSIKECEEWRADLYRDLDLTFHV